MAKKKKNPKPAPLASASAARRIGLDADQLGLVGQAKQHIHQAIEQLGPSVSEGDTDAEEAVLQLTTGLSLLNALAQSSQKTEEAAHA